MAKIHVHTKYSLLDAIIEPEELVKKCVAQGDNALCVTEHGNVYSNVEVYKCCKKYGVKYLYGCEVYICDDVNVRDKNNRYHHLVVIAMNETGRINLNKLVSESCNYKYYGKPRIDFEMLVKYSDGLLVCSACMAGEVQRALIEEDFGTAEQIALKYKSVFNDNYYLEYQSHSDQTQQLLNRRVVDLANKLKIKYIVTTDAHYLNKDDQKYHNIFVQIGQTREVGETYTDCYLQSDEEILSICKSTTKEENLIAINNTNEIADKCNVDIPLSAPIMPHVNVPKNFRNELEYLKSLCVQGWKNKKIGDKPNKKEYKERLRYEMNAIAKMGFEGYFLLVHSYCNSVKRRGIARGSAGGSLVCYLTNITDIDPIEYGLYFERFIDVGALDLLEQGKITKNELKIPDVDSDFGKEDREKVLQYVIERYGKDRVVSLGSFQYIWAKGAIKDIGRVLGIQFEVTNEMTSQLGDESIKEVVELGLLDKYKEKYPELFDYASKLAGLPRSFSAHPCGKVISMDDIYQYNATDINDEGLVILQGDMHTADDLGLIKADFLGLRTVDVIYDTLEMIGKDYEYIAPHNINFKDEKVFANFRNGNTSGIFQFESAGMKDTLRKIECNSINDLSVANALYRPGSKKYIDNYANRKKGVEEYDFLHEDLKPILQETFSIIVYQEQLIEIGRLAGLSNPDELRKATAKKKASLLDKIKPELFDGLSKRGWSEEQLNQLWDTMLDFAMYSFNKAHSAAYAIIAYICMYLKTYYPKEYICSWMNSVSGKVDKIAVCIQEANRLGIKCYHGKYNNCSSNTVLYKDGIMIGTETVKDCNAQMAEELMDMVSKQQPYDSFVSVLNDIKQFTSINNKQLSILITLDYFSEFGNNGKLLKAKDYFKKFMNVKTIKKDKIESLGLSEYIVKKFANKETAKQYSEIDNIGLVEYMINGIQNEPLSVPEQIKAEEEHLGYIMYKNPDMKEYYVVLDYKVYDDPCRPYFSLYNLSTGEKVSCKINDRKIYNRNPFGHYSIIHSSNFTKSDDKWTPLERYEVIKR